MLEDRLNSLLLVWEEQRLHGRDLPAAELCRDCPDLAEELNRRIEALRRMNNVMQPGDAAPLPAVAISDLPAAQQAMHSAATLPPTKTSLLPELANQTQHEIVRELGRGGMGVVYLAYNRLMARQEVLKVVNKELLQRAGGKARFLREIQAAAQLHHPNVVTAYSALQIGELLVFAMQYIEGEDLQKLVQTRGPLPIVHACSYIQQAALGLQHAFEKGMVHRDIKPQNLILSREGKMHVIKVLDFGLAKVMREKEQDGRLTASGEFLGTPAYGAPEQMRDAAHADIRADIYSLGCTLYFLLTGDLPFKGSLFELFHAHQSAEPPLVHLVRPEVPEPLTAVVKKMMAKDPADRYQTPLEVVQALAAFIKPEAGDTAAMASHEPRQDTATIGGHGARATTLEPPPRQVRDGDKERGKHKAAHLETSGPVARQTLAGNALRRRRLLIVGLGLAVVLPAAVLILIFAPWGARRGPLSGDLILRVWAEDGSKRGLKVGEDPAALPVRNGELVQLEARLNQSAYVYLIWVDSEGNVASLYPWEERDFQKLPGVQSSVAELQSPPQLAKGWPVVGPSGLETAMMLVRGTPLPADVNLVEAIGKLKPSPFRDPREVAVRGFDRNQPTGFLDMGQNRGLGTIAAEVDEPLLQLMERLRPHFEMIRAVRFAHQGD